MSLALMLAWLTARWANVFAFSTKLSRFEVPLEKQTRALRCLVGLGKRYLVGQSAGLPDFCLPAGVVVVMISHRESRYST